eukprot:IDg5384t1
MPAAPCLAQSAAPSLCQGGYLVSIDNQQVFTRPTLSVAAPTLLAHRTRGSGLVLLETEIQLSGFGTATSGAKLRSSKLYQTRVVATIFLGAECLASSFATRAEIQCRRFVWNPSILIADCHQPEPHMRVETMRQHPGTRAVEQWIQGRAFLNRHALRASQVPVPPRKEGVLKQVRYELSRNVSTSNLYCIQVYEHGAEYSKETDSKDGEYTWSRTTAHHKYGPM